MLNNVIHTKSLAAITSLFSFEEGFKNTSGTSLSEYSTQNQFGKERIMNYEIRKLEQMSTVMLHHDAITGTNTESAAGDYFE
jgi:hypothetical protein